MPNADTINALNSLGSFGLFLLFLYMTARVAIPAWKWYAERDFKVREKQAENDAKLADAYSQQAEEFKQFRVVVDSTTQVMRAHTNAITGVAQNASEQVRISQRLIQRMDNQSSKLDATLDKTLNFGEMVSQSTAFTLASVRNLEASAGALAEGLDHALAGEQQIYEVVERIEQVVNKIADRPDCTEAIRAELRELHNKLTQMRPPTSEIVEVVNGEKSHDERP